MVSRAEYAAALDRIFNKLDRDGVELISSEMLLDALEALESYAGQTLYTEDETMYIKPGKEGWDDPPTYSEFSGGAGDALEKIRKELGLSC